MSSPDLCTVQLIPTRLPISLELWLGRMSRQTSAPRDFSSFRQVTLGLWWQLAMFQDSRTMLGLLSSVQSHNVSDSLRPHGLQCTRFPVHHQLMEFTQTHVHWISGSIQPSHPLRSPSPPTFNLAKHQGLCKWVSSSHQVAKVLEFQLQHQSFQWTLRTDLL